MKATGVLLYPGASQRLALLFAPRVVSTMVPPGFVGVYLLLKDRRPVYVGRSDHCVRSRLLAHPLLQVATHFVWEPCRDPTAAYHLEAFWFHRLLDTSKPRNLVHPARPEGSLKRCPFCDDGDECALVQALQECGGSASGLQSNVESINPFSGGTRQ